MISDPNATSFRIARSISTPSRLKRSRRSEPASLRSPSNPSSPTIRVSAHDRTEKRFEDFSARRAEPARRFAAHQTRRIRVDRWTERRRQDDAGQNADRRRTADAGANRHWWLGYHADPRSRHSVFTPADWRRVSGFQAAAA